ncbi:MAG: bifunctional tetrahydrofolate synthase/dihydrofolate synthase [Pseudomonadales bacterium]|nr:bifunctional tetrahydrofolate synthase/dihydrofolate synthase [Pseudomonadales bacterium]NRA17800.1 bifunctional tetrahydrofolate synthase/dihydrofolate synthase [Oceanospirillaceae bacterium]
MNRTEYNLAQWLEWMESNHPTEIDLGLARVGQVYRQMGVDLSATKIISIAGTNGKGSTTALLESIYLAAEYSTLAYTSPHMLHYNERVRLDGIDVDDALLIAAFNAIDVAMGVADSRISLSYFEISTLAAIYLVGEVKPDIALLEVGLGGALDAVNIVDADLAIITTLSIDHVDWLGDDIEQIGREKAGIGRANRPLVCGELQPPKSIALICAENDFNLFQAITDFSYVVDTAAGQWDWCGVDLSGQPLNFTQLGLPELPVQNASTALQAISLLGVSCSQVQIQRGLMAAKAAGRQQLIDYCGASVLLDVAHNPQSAQYLAASLKAQNLSKKVQLVLGVLADKDCQELALALAPLVAQWHFVSLDVSRGQSAEQLRQKVLEQDVGEQPSACYDGVEQALTAAIAAAKADHQVVVAGSFVTVAAVLQLLEEDG